MQRISEPTNEIKPTEEIHSWRKPGVEIVSSPELVREFYLGSRDGFRIPRGGRINRVGTER